MLGKGKGGMNSAVSIPQHTRKTGYERALHRKAAKPPPAAMKPQKASQSSPRRPPQGTTRLPEGVYGAVESLARRVVGVEGYLDTWRRGGTNTPAKRTTVCFNAAKHYIGMRQRGHQSRF